MDAGIVLVNPSRLLGLVRRPSRTNEPHLGLAYLAAYLRRGGYDVSVIDADAEGLTVEQTAERAEAARPIFVGITAPTALVKSAAELARRIKQANPDRITVLGGYHATVMPAESLEEFDAFDYAVFGEGETAALGLARALVDGTPARSLPGVASRNNGEVILGPPAEIVDDLDELPPPAWDLFPLASYQAHYRSDSDVLELPVSTGRGCPGRCRFCARVTGGRLRRRSATHVVDEVEDDILRLGAGAIVFMDESFAADRERVAGICEEMIRRDLPKRFYWLCQTRVDTVDGDLLRLMKRAGCRHIAYGVESGDPDVLAASGKGTDLDRIRTAVRDAREVGILVDNFFLLGLPGETAASIRRTVRFSLELNSDFANFFILVPYPGTEVFRLAARGAGGLRLLTRDWDQYGIQMGRALELDTLPRSRLERLQFYAYLRFYLRPSRIGNMLRMVNLRVLPIYLWNLVTGMTKRLDDGRTQIEGR